MYAQFVKRPLDMLLALIALLFLAPVFLVTAVAIVLEDGLPVLFRQQRSGRDKRPFEVLKFRSMGRDAPQVASADAGALRITSVGAIIRRLNVDELPQLVNILRGDMSVVGPRPALTTQSTLLDLRDQGSANTVRPGLTGLAQVSSYDGMPEEEKASLDNDYARRVTFFGDVRIILRTFVYLLKPPPVY
ncbi:MAG: sugar transferase [Pseudomonadota bacterium]